MTELHVGKSSATDARVAAREAVREALEGAEAPVFALVFSTDQYDHELLATSLSAELGDVPWAGCCTAGVFAGNTLLTQGLAIGVISSSDLRVGVGIGGPVSVDGRMAGQTAVAAAIAAVGGTSAGRHRAMIVLPDALTGNAVDVVRGAAAEAGTGISWAGGGAGDNLRFVQTAQYAHGRAFHDRAIAIFIDANRPFGSGLRHGWRPYGAPTTVTKTQGARVQSLDYESAFDVYRRTVERRGDKVTLDSFAAFSMTHPLGIPQADGEHVIRDPLAVEDDGSLRFIAEVPDGSIVRVMEGDRNALIAAALAAATDARTALGGEMAGAFVFDCISRSMILEGEIKDELAALQEGLGANVPMIGCLTFGEVGGSGTGVPQFHNKTAVVLTLPR
jgi:hypothetical protein